MRARDRFQRALAKVHFWVAFVSSADSVTFSLALFTDVFMCAVSPSDADGVLDAVGVGARAMASESRRGRARLLGAHEFRCVVLSTMGY